MYYFAIYYIYLCLKYNFLTKRYMLKTKSRYLLSAFKVYLLFYNTSFNMLITFFLVNNFGLTALAPSLIAVSAIASRSFSVTP